MQRILEPELMDDDMSASAYAQADFSASHDHFVALLVEKFPCLPAAGQALDLGCGPADPSIRFARRFPAWQLTAVDGAEAMLQQAYRALSMTGLAGRIRLVHAQIAESSAFAGRYDCLFSNSLLHHLPDPRAMWDCIRRHVAGTRVFVMDLVRPASPECARAMTERYASQCPPVLQRDFYNSLCAAHTPAEIAQQLQSAGLRGLSQEQISDRHIIVHGAL